MAAEPRPPRQPAPALHYHFASNAELGEALIARYAASFTGALAALDSDAMTAPAITGVPRLAWPSGSLCRCRPGGTTEDEGHEQILERATMRNP